MNFLAKALLKKQLKGQIGDVPDEQIDLLISAVEKNPDFFKGLAEEIKTKVAGGMDQQVAAMEIMKTKQSELRAMLGK